MDYIKTTDFAVKDILPSGDPAKKILGSEIDTEFNNIAESISTKVTRLSGSVINTIPTVALTGDLQDSGYTIIDIVNMFYPPGTIMDFGGTVVPTGFRFLLCDGSEVSRSLYSDLFNVIGTRFGEGDGVSTFNLPDFRGRVAVGAGQGGGLTNRTLADKGGEETHKLTQSEMPKHRHLEGSATRDSYGVGENVASGTRRSGGASEPNGRRFYTTEEGGDQPHNNMQPFLVVNKIIKY